MKIELRNIKANLKLVLDTTIFLGDLYINGVKVAHADNVQLCGNTKITPIGSGKMYKENFKLVKKAEDYCKTLPPEIFLYEDGPTTKSIVIKACLKTYVDNLVEQFVKDKDAERFQNKLNRDLQRFVCISKSRNIEEVKDYRTIKFKSYVSIKDIFSNPNLKEKVLAHISQRKKEGYFVLNSNLPI